jgi:hypothetical protein
MSKITFNEWVKYCLWADVETHFQFTSKDKKIQENFECDFTAILKYKDQTYMYAICFEPHTEDKYFILMRWDGCLYYRGDNIDDLFKIIKKEFEELHKVMIEREKLN